MDIRKASGAVRSSRYHSLDMRLSEEYLEFCRSRKEINRTKDISVRGVGEPPVLGHHIDPSAGGDSDDWDHPNIAPLTPAENYAAHVMRFLSDPDDPEELAEIRLTTNHGQFDTPEKFERHIVWLYDTYGKFDCLVNRKWN